MLGLRSPMLALALLGACLGACFTDSGAPMLPTGTGDADPSMGPTTADPGTSTTGTTTTGDTTTGDTTTTTTTTTATSATSTGCVPLKWFFDIDKDGYGGPMSTEKCEAPGADYYLDSLDCDDSNPYINPGALEVCDGFDNDCDGGIDEFPDGPMVACNGCTPVLGVTSTYYMCDAPERAWDEARTKCKTLLGDLVSINDIEEGKLVATAAGADLRWLIGLTDSASEGQFVWVDNSPLDPNVASWAMGEPNNTDIDVPGPANCATIGAFAWRDQSCIDASPIICEVPY